MPTELSSSLRHEWDRLLQRLGVDPAASERALATLVAAYSADDRHYHNLEHLEEMFEVVHRLAGSETPPEVGLAIWFHDVVYDTRRHDNESRSAELAGDSLRPLGLTAEAIDRVQHLIRATAHLVEHNPPRDRETALLLDADLAILGSPPDRYRRYAAAIRREYAWVPDPDYRTGRAKVLGAFLARPRIYLHETLHEEVEPRARQNLSDELATLE